MIKMTRYESIEWLKQCLADAKLNGQTEIKMYLAEVEELIISISCK